MEPFTRFIFLQTSKSCCNFAASISETTPELTLQNVSGGNKNRITTMTNTALQAIATKALPALSGEQLTYNAAKNIFLSQGYTSAAGNMYYKAIRLSNRLMVYYDLGQGYAYTFLNGIKLFCFDGQKANLIAQKYWGGCDYRIFNEQFAKEQSILMLKGFLEGQLKLPGAHVSDQELASFARGMVEETQRKQLA